MMNVVLLLLTTFLMQAFSTDPVINKESVDHAPQHRHDVRDHYDMEGKHYAEYDHEAVLGSRELDKEFEELSPAESKRRLGIIVDKMDLDKNGFITREELKQWVHKSFRMLDDEEAMEKFDDQDTNKDGNITWPEYLDQAYGYTLDEVEDFQGDKNPQVQAIAEMISLDKEKFQAADINKDGYLERSEYPPFMHPYNFEFMHDIEIKRILKDYDTNRDGTIDFQEYRGEEFPFEGSKEDEIVDRETFKSYDLNKDGKLDHAEIERWALPDHDEAAEGEAEHLIWETDINKDGKLTKSEILHNHELWVGSSVTDYGHHLHDHEEL